MNNFKSQGKQWISLDQKVIQVPFITSVSYVDEIILSPNKKYGAFKFSKKQDQMILLFDLENSDFMDRFQNEKINYYQREIECQFSPNSKVFIFPGRTYYIVYNIEQNCQLFIYISVFQEINFSLDSSKYLCASENTIFVYEAFSKTGKQVFQKDAVHTIWRISSSQGFLMRYDGGGISYFMIQNESLRFIKTIIITKQFYSYPIMILQEQKISEFREQSLISVYQGKIFRIYNQQVGKLIRKRHQEALQLQIKLLPDKNMKQVLVSLSFPNLDWRKIIVMQILPEIKLQPIHLIVPDVFLFNRNQIHYFKESDANESQGEICYYF